MKKLLLALSIIAGTATTFLVMQQKPTQAKAYNEYEANYMYLSSYNIENIVATDPLLHIEFQGTFKYFKEKPQFYSYTEKNIIYELNDTHITYLDRGYMNFELYSLTDVDANKTENYNDYFELFKDTKYNDDGDSTLTVITNNTASKITNWNGTKNYELVINTYGELDNQEVINDVVRQTLKNLKIANSKYAQDKITTFGTSEEYLYKQGYNEGYYAGQLKGKTENYNKGYNEGYNKGQNEGYDTGKDIGYEFGFADGFDYALQNEMENEYSKGYKEGYEKAIKDANVLPDTIFTTVGAVAGFIAQFGKVELLGISLLDIFAMFMIVGVILLITKVVL